MAVVEMVNIGLNLDPGFDQQYCTSLPMDSVHKTAVICCREIISRQKPSLVAYHFGCMGKKALLDRVFSILHTHGQCILFHSYFGFDRWIFFFS